MPEEAQGLPPYRRIAAQIMRKIDQGDIRPGDHVPSVRKIMETEGVSVGTATRVAAVLRAEGYAETIPGVGTVARLPSKLTTGPDRLQLQRSTGSGFRPGERVEILSAELVPAPRDVADALEVDVGSPVIRRQRRYVDDEGVVALSTSWLPGKFAESAPELVSTDPLPKMTFGLIEERTGRRAVKRRDVVSLQDAPEDAAELLNVEAGTPVLTMTNLYWDQRGDVTEYATDFLGPGRELSTEYDLS